MNEAQVRTLEQLRQVLEGIQSRQFRQAEEGHYAWIESVRWRFDYRLNAMDAPTRNGIDVPKWKRYSTT